MQSEMLVVYAGAVTIVAVGLGLEMWGRKKLARRRKADMIRSALREEGRPAGIKAYDNAIIRERLQEEHILYAAQTNSPVDYFEMGRKLAADSGCAACRCGYHSVPGYTCPCPCHQDEKVPA